MAWFKIAFVSLFCCDDPVYIILLGVLGCDNYDTVSLFKKKTFSADNIGGVSGFCRPSVYSN